VGRSQLNAVESLLVQAIAHEMKAQAWPDTRYVAGWLAEAKGFRGDAVATYARSMRQRIDVGNLYRRALDRIPAHIDGIPPLPLPETCPYALDDLLPP